MTYRQLGEVPMYPVEETAEARNIRIVREQEVAKEKKKIRDSRAALGLAAFPAVAIMGVGLEWTNMNSATAATSIIAIVIASIGVVAATAIRLDW